MKKIMLIAFLLVAGLLTGCTARVYPSGYGYGGYGGYAGYGYGPYYMRPRVYVAPPVVRPAPRYYQPPRGGWHGGGWHGGRRGGRW